MTNRWQMLERLFANNWTPHDGLGAIVLSPTRELAFQIFEVLRKVTTNARLKLGMPARIMHIDPCRRHTLSLTTTAPTLRRHLSPSPSSSPSSCRQVGKYHRFSAGLTIGGKDHKEEAKRIAGMNILIATPGRLLQHMEQTPGFDWSGLRVLGRPRAPAGAPGAPPSSFPPLFLSCSPVSSSASPRTLPLVFPPSSLFLPVVHLRSPFDSSSNITRSFSRTSPLSDPQCWMRPTACLIWALHRPSTPSLKCCRASALPSLPFSPSSPFPASALCTAKCPYSALRVPALLIRFIPPLIPSPLPAPSFLLRGGPSRPVRHYSSRRR